MAYVELREPIVVNDLANQRLLMDRRDVYRILEENSIAIPRYFYLFPLHLLKNLLNFKLKNIFAIEISLSTVMDTIIVILQLNLI